MKSFSYQVRGTNGSGKTTVVRRLIQAATATSIQISPKFKPEIYRGILLGRETFFLGSYETTCGGCDTIDNVARVAELLKQCMSIPHSITIYEGLMISHMLGTVGKAQEEMGLENCILAYIDTPLEECIRRVVARRVEAGNDKPFDPRNVVKDFNSVQLNRKRAIKLGYRVRDVPHQEAYEWIWEDIKNEVTGR